MSGATCDGAGWVYFNEDAGEEYAPNHPVKSGEVPNATRIRRSTTQEDVLWSAFQAEFQRAHALETATPSQRLDAATVERCAQIVRECGPQNPESDWTEHARIRAHMRDRILNEFALATEPHQHGGKGA